MTKVAFVGLGIMGAPMARNLLAAGFDVVGYNRSFEKVDRFVRDGGRGADSIAEATKGAEFVIMMLPDTIDVEEVMKKENGLLASCRPGTTIIDMSTISPNATALLRTLALEQSIFYIDAPVSGGEQGAIEGTLSIMVGGDADVVERARPVLDAMGTTVVRVGRGGSGQTVKAANQLIVAGIIELVSEALTFLDAHHVDLESAVRVLAGGLAGNAVLDRKAAGMLARNFEPGFRVDLHHKDLGIFSDAARQFDVATPLGAVVTQLMASLHAQGMGSLDHSALLLQVERLSGREGAK